jgi:putative oxygen-independent coproporphyrinogen III oxidase
VQLGPSRFSPGKFYFSRHPAATLSPLSSLNAANRIFRPSNRPADRELAVGPPAVPWQVPSAAYLHIPFCRRRCFYCDFPISVVGDRLRGEESGTIRDYIDVLAQEIQQTAALTLDRQPLETIFFGGGTPSLLSAHQVERILTLLNAQFGIASNAEIAMEMDPGTFDWAQIAGYRSAGLTRVSLGAQAFQDDLLQRCGRTHTVADIETAVALVRRSGIANLSLDLMSGLPGQTRADWQASLDRAIALAPAHLSNYDLTIEPGTAFGKRLRPGEQPLPSDDLTADMYRLAHETLTAAGYGHYEVCSYAQPGYQCRHNRVYWENQPFYGFGMGATSYLQGQRVARPRTLSTYRDWVRGAQSASAATLTGDAPPPDAIDLLLDQLLTGLRLSEGVSMVGVRAQFGEGAADRVWQALQPDVLQGWVEGVFTSGQIAAANTPASELDRLRFTAPEGFLFSNIGLQHLFDAFDE